MEWISVNERLPDDKFKVICAKYKSGDLGLFYKGPFDEETGMVTHWSYVNVSDVEYFIELSDTPK